MWGQPNPNPPPGETRQLWRCRRRICMLNSNNNDYNLWVIVGVRCRCQLPAELCDAALIKATNAGTEHGREGKWAGSGERRAQCVAMAMGPPQTKASSCNCLGPAPRLPSQPTAPLVVFFNFSYCFSKKAAACWSGKRSVSAWKGGRQMRTGAGAAAAAEAAAAPSSALSGHVSPSLRKIFILFAARYN